jgi:hypothetical protein
MLDVVRYGQYGGKLHLLCHGWYVYTSRTKQTSLLTVNKMEIVRLTIHHDWIVIVSFMYYLGDYFRETSADVHSLPQCPVDSSKSCDVACHTP